MEKCAVCKKEYSSFDFITYSPVCSEVCWLMWINITDHRGKPCWVPGCLEVYCGIETPGHCYKCPVFIIDEEIKKRGLDKNALTVSY